ncbi:MAG: NADPH:quinone reductase [Terriglobales bacterium]
MKAIVVREFGGPEVLQYGDTPTPRPAAGQVLVRVHAAGVNPYDTYMRSGTYAIKPPLPYTPGSDAAGVVEAVGEGVSRVAAGDRVYTAATLTGAYAEYALALETQVHPLPERTSFPQGAGVWVPYGTAFHALCQRTRLRPGETVLIHGASGGVGIAAVQMARALGAAVWGTAGSARGLELAQREGAHRVFDHTQPGYLDQIMAASNGRGVDLIVEMLANVNLGSDLKLLAPRGRVVVIGCRGDVTLSPRDLMGRHGAILAFTLWNINDPERQEILSGLYAGLENGTLRPVVGKQLPLAQAAQAHRDILAPGAFGKIVLLP